MFTPPPSPFLKPSQQDMVAEQPSPGSRDLERRPALRSKWGIILVPAVLIFIALSTRYISHPTFFDFIPPSPGVRVFEPGQSKFTFHDRHPRQASSLTSVSAPSASSPSPSAFQPVPTIPSNPTLPTPFPQPFDTTLSHNFSTVSCSDFFNNMTLAFEFRQCRSFSLLYQSSSAFLSAQGNITLLNDLVWGTCNTDVTSTQCTATMNGFASSLRSNCATDLANDNVFVGNALAGLLTYSLMRRVACQVDPSTNAYCYVNAANSPSPSDLYFYQLPYGIGVPNTTTPTCSPCVRAVMDLYLAVVNGTDPDTTDNSVRTMLSQTYSTASQLLAKTCGGAYVQTTNVVSGDLPPLVISTKAWSIVAGVVMISLVCV